MDKDQVAAVLDEIGTLLELQGENSFRCNAYHNAARAIEQLETNLAEVVAQGKLGDIPGIGDTLQRENHHPRHHRHAAVLRRPQAPRRRPACSSDAAHARDSGRRRSRRCTTSSGIDDLDKLKAACEAGQVAKLKGFGAKTQQKILEGIQLPRRDGRPRAHRPGAAAGPRRCSTACATLPGVMRMELCGSLRRRKETIKDIDILISADDAGADHGALRQAAAGRAGDRPRRRPSRASSSARRRRGENHDERRPARGQRRAVPVRPALFHRQQGTQHRHAQPRSGVRPEAQRVRAGRRRSESRQVQGRGRHLHGARPGLHSAGDARGHRRDRGRREARRCRSWSRPTTSRASSTATPTASDGTATRSKRWPRPRRNWA